MRKEPMVIAKILQTGDDQTVLLPRAFQFPIGIDEVSISREGERLILAPIQHEEWPEDFWKAFEGVSDDFERPRPPGHKCPG
ncbi:MAG TPA: hypothetical protein VF789_11100 [Thermoanaerobaculia bacterium]